MDEVDKMTGYSRGANFERRIRKHFESQGWTCFRSAGSHSPADLICIKGGEIMLVHCQLDSYFPPAKIEQLKAIAEENNCRYLLAWRDKKKIQFKEATNDRTKED